MEKTGPFFFDFGSRMKIAPQKGDVLYRNDDNGEIALIRTTKERRMIFYLCHAFHEEIRQISYKDMNEHISKDPFNLLLYLLPAFGHDVKALGHYPGVQFTFGNNIKIL